MQSTNIHDVAHIIETRRNLKGYQDADHVVRRLTIFDKKGERFELTMFSPKGKSIYYEYIEDSDDAYNEGIDVSAKLKRAYLNSKVKK